MKKLVLAALGAMSLNANAAIINVNGLNWLSLDNTVNMNREDALAANPGYRLGTNAEVEGLMVSYFGGSLAFIDISRFSTSHSEDVDAVSRAQVFTDDFMGRSDGDGGWWSQGVYIDEDDLGRVAGAITWSVNYSFAEIKGLENDAATYTENFAHANYGHFLVAGPVPIPAAAWLFGSALGMLGWMGRMLTH